MKRIITIVVFLISITAFSQDTYLQNGSATAEEQAKELTKQYNDQLVMETNQRLLFQKKVEEFLISSNKVKDTYKGRDMLNKLYELRQNEIAEMGDILTRIQLDKYKQVRQDIQPLATVEEEK
ncbi:MAG: hypothetical protein ACSHW7_06580 [Patiriisocius sp.]|uniref:hypothetical protein n=1 Tax=Patiriisocius sp. TaxID=2822396 RepID=UPI003EF95937